MTRAKQALVVSGAENRKAHRSWYRRIADALGLGNAGGVLGDDLALAAVSQALQPPAPMPRRVRPAVFPDPPLLPRLIQPLPTGTRANAFATAATRRGERVHLLLQHVAPPGSVTDRSWLRELLEVDETAFGSLWADAQAILAAPQLRRFFDPARYVSAHNELAYVDAAGQLRRIDRVVEFADEIWVLDYKTGDAPQTISRYRPQIEAYRQAMMTLAAGKPVRAALVFAGGYLEPV
jgi:ATP-dependent helicase/nuclease subunit A